jgi:hypothetical protein
LFHANIKQKRKNTRKNSRNGGGDSVPPFSFLRFIPGLGGHVFVAHPAGLNWKEGLVEFEFLAVGQREIIHRPEDLIPREKAGITVDHVVRIQRRVTFHHVSGLDFLDFLFRLS